MAVTMIGAGSMNYFKAIGVDMKLIDHMNALGIKVELGFNSLRFKKADGVILATCALPVNTNAVMKGAITASQQVEVRNAVTYALKGALSKFTDLPPVKITAMTEPLDVLVAANLKNAGKSPEPPQPYAKKAPPVADLMKSEPIKLSEATQMYQPVRGTSHGSRYIVVAMTENLRFAARVKSKALSVRVEGIFSLDDQKKLAAMGFKEHTGYMSAHVEGMTNSTPSRVLGAMLMGSGLKFTTPMPDLELVESN